MGVLGFNQELRSNHLCDNVYNIGSAENAYTAQANAYDRDSGVRSLGFVKALNGIAR